MGSSAKNSPSTFGFFDFRDVLEDIAGELRLDSEADVDEGRDTEQVFMVQGGGSLCGVARLRDLDSEEGLLTKVEKLMGPPLRQCWYNRDWSNHKTYLSYDLSFVHPDPQAPTGHGDRA